MTLKIVIKNAKKHKLFLLLNINLVISASMKAYQSPPYEDVKPYNCHHPKCLNPSEEAIMQCLDPAVCAMLADVPPPLYLCQKCYDSLDDVGSELFLHVNQPADLVSQICDNTDCRFGFMKALYFCFSLDCIKKNNYKPIRLCQDCHERFVVFS